MQAYAKLQVVCPVGVCTVSLCSDKLAAIYSDANGTKKENYNKYLTNSRTQLSQIHNAYTNWLTIAGHKVFEYEWKSL